MEVIRVLVMTVFLCHPVHIAVNIDISSNSPNTVLYFDLSDLI